MVAVLLLLQGTALGWSATWQSPTLNEPGQLASGIAHWTFLRFEPACINPPLIRMVAAMPAILFRCETDWSGMSLQPGERCEGTLGSDFVRVNGVRTQDLTVWGRWTLIPVSLFGGYLCWRWATELYGRNAGLLAIWLWCWDPNLIAHGQLITNDLPATTFGLAAAYAFWKWLRRPGLQRAFAAGAWLGAALLAKFTWLILLPLWPLLWVLFRSSDPSLRQRSVWRTCLADFPVMFITAAVIINTAYAWRDVGWQLRQFSFTSRLMAGPDLKAKVGNRFTGSLLATTPVPLAADYLRGVDLQWRDHESTDHRSYLAGTWRRGGWWYYYLYAACVKLPVGLLVIAAAASCNAVRHWRTCMSIPRAMAVACVAAPATVLFIMVSSQTAFTHHARYVLPCLGPLIVLSSSVVERCRPRTLITISACAVSVFVSSILAAPGFIGYFNELAGGLRNGHEHLLHSSLDWGQDLVSLKEWQRHNGDESPLHVAYHGLYDPIDYGIRGEIAPFGPVRNANPAVTTLVPGWYAISANYVFGSEWGLAPGKVYSAFRHLTPVARLGTSMYLYHIDASVARELSE